MTHMIGWNELEVHARMRGERTPGDMPCMIMENLTLSGGLLTSHRPV